MESHIEDLGDFIDDIQLLFDEDDPSSVVVRAHSNPLVHSLHDQSLQVDVIVKIMYNSFRRSLYHLRRHFVLWNMFHIHPC